MNTFLKNIFTDNTNEVYSSKKFISIISFIICIIIALVDQFTTHKINMEIFNSFLILSGGQSVLSIIDNKINSEK